MSAAKGTFKKVIVCGPPGMTQVIDQTFEAFGAKYGLEPNQIEVL